MTDFRGGGSRRRFAERILAEAERRKRGASSAATYVTILGASFSIATRTANYTLTSGDYTTLADATAGNITITLPAAAGATGREYNIKKTDATANTVTVDGNGSETIDGATTAVLTLQWESITVQSDGTAWYIL